MSKTDFFNRENRTSFFLNFLAVVLGIVITFGGESLLSRKEEKKNLNNCLDLVASELQTNRDYFTYCDSLLEDEVKAASFLIRYEDDYRKAPSDSLMMYANIPLTLDEISIYTDAFELLKTSGVLTKVKDKRLALQIFEVYGAMQNLAQYMNLYFDHKEKYLEPAMNDEVKNLLASDDVTAEGFWSKMSDTKEGRQFLREMLRFLSLYDPSDIYEAADDLIGAIREYSK